MNNTKKISKSLLIVSAFLFLSTANTQAQGLPDNKLNDIYPENIKWSSFSAFPPEASLSVLIGDPKSTGSYIVRVKVPAGLKLMPHTHPENRIYTVISGVFYIGIGKEFDASKLKAYPPGSIIVLPGNTPHFHGAKSGDYITQVSANGPLGIDYLHSEDDPRNQKH